MKLTKTKNKNKIDSTHYDSIFQLDYVPNENQWSIDSCTLVIPTAFIKMGKNPLTSIGGRYIKDQVNDGVIYLDEKKINGHWFEGKYQDYYVYRAEHNNKRVICINLVSKILGKYYYLGISKKTFPIVVDELLEMFKGSIIFINDWFKHSYFLDVEFKRDTFIDSRNYRESLINIALSAEGQVKRFYNGQRNIHTQIDQRLITGMANTHYSENKKRSSKSMRNAFWHIYIKNFQMEYAHKLKNAKDEERTIRNYNGHYEMLKLCGRPKDLVLRLEVNMGSSKLMETLGIEKSIMNILSLSSDEIESRIVKPLLRGKFSNFKVDDKPTERLTIDFRILYEMYKEKAFSSTVEDSNKWLKSYGSNLSNLSDRTMKSFNERIKVFEKRFRYEEENFRLDQNDMFAVFGEKIGIEMLLSKIPKMNQIRAMQRRLE